MKKIYALLLPFMTLSVNAQISVQGTEIEELKKQVQETADLKTRLEQLEAKLLN